ncbi:hypothetical protein GCM10010182_10660 [Actinomadura cremea]|nr:hypothetical protein GCM10010182_10660 [Actinomadura cremea]
MLGAPRRRFPRLEVTVFEEPNSAEMERLGRRGMVDLALMAACEQSPADAHHLGHEEFVVVPGAGHRLLAADRVELRDLAGEPWVRFDRDSALDGVLLDGLRDLNPSKVARVSQAATAVRWAAHGLGATLVPSSTVPPRSQAPRPPGVPGRPPARHRRGPIRRGPGRDGPARTPTPGDLVRINALPTGSCRRGQPIGNPPPSTMRFLPVNQLA